MLLQCQVGAGYNNTLGVPEPLMAIDRLYTQHERHFEQFHYVYPVLSRRSQGISVGINLNPDKICNFHCIYCQVDRVSETPTSFVDMERLVDELNHVLRLVVSGELFTTEKFHATPASLRRLNDIAFSGDGEPTTFRNFEAIVRACAAVKQRHELDQVKLVLITNSSMLDRDNVQCALRVLDANQGEIWAKLDAGSEAYYRRVNRAATPFERILGNLRLVARQRPIVIQTLWMRIAGAAPPPPEIDAYCDRLKEITDAGGHIKLVQLCTVARPAAESYVTPLPDDELDQITEHIAQRTQIPCRAYYGARSEEDRL